MSFNELMAAYSLDLRKRIVDAVERGIATKREIARMFGVHETFVHKLLRQKRERGDIAPLPHGGGVVAFAGIFARLQPDRRVYFKDQSDFAFA